MTVRIDISYDGDLQCTATHAPSGDRLVTDAPVDNAGRGAHFSPTDLVATGLGTCLMTIMGIVGQRQNYDLSGSRVVVDKEMSSGSPRLIRRLAVRVLLPASLSERARRRLEDAASTCPVAASLGPSTEIDLTFEYG